MAIDRLLHAGVDTDSGPSACVPRLMAGKSLDRDVAVSPLSFQHQAGADDLDHTHPEVVVCDDVAVRARGFFESFDAGEIVVLGDESLGVV